MSAGIRARGFEVDLILIVLRGGATAPPLGLFRRVSLGGDAVATFKRKREKRGFRSRPPGETWGVSIGGRTVHEVS